MVVVWRNPDASRQFIMKNRCLERHWFPNIRCIVRTSVVSTGVWCGEDTALEAEKSHRRRRVMIRMHRIALGAVARNIYIETILTSAFTV